MNDNVNMKQRPIGDSPSPCEQHRWHLSLERPPVERRREVKVKALCYRERRNRGALLQKSRQSPRPQSESRYPVLPRTLGFRRTSCARRKSHGIRLHKIPEESHRKQIRMVSAWTVTSDPVPNWKRSSDAMIMGRR